MPSPKLPLVPKPPPGPPRMIDPTVLFARLRQKQKAAQAMGKQSTILASANAPLTGTSSSLLSGRSY